MVHRRGSGDRLFRTATRRDGAARRRRFPPAARPRAAIDRLGSSGLGYDGIAPGPTLRVRRGDELRVRLVNELAAPTSVHWHGIRLPNAMDGVPQLTQPAVAPGASFDYRFRPPDAGTFWYHAYIAGQTDRGLAGAFIVEDAQPVDVDRDIALLLTTPAAADGPPVLVNGSARPDIAVKTGERLRLRIVNATTARGLFRQARWTRGPGDGDRRPARRAVPRARQPRGARTRQPDRSVRRYDWAMPGPWRRFSPHR